MTKTAANEDVSLSEASRAAEAAKNPRKFMLAGVNQLQTKAQIVQSIKNNKSGYAGKQYVIMEAISVVKTQDDRAMESLPVLEV